MSDNVVAFVCNHKYLPKLQATLKQLRSPTKGRWTGDVALIHGGDIVESDLAQMKSEGLLTHDFHVPEFDTTKIITQRKRYQIRANDDRIFTKCFQYHKVYVFSTFMKAWKHVLYVDSGMIIIGDVNRFFKLDVTNKLLAHSDAYPSFQWKLYTQFDCQTIPQLTNELVARCDLHGDYFQTTMLLFDTNLITDNTVSDLTMLSTIFFNSITNEQGVMNVYFNGIHKVWHQIPLTDEKGHLYDFWTRDNIPLARYCMVKYLH